MRDSNYDLFLTRAICRPVENSKYNYYIDKKKDKLICVLNEANNFDKNWIELPRLSTQAKKDFVINFAKKEAFKTDILEILERIDDSSIFDIENQLKKIDFDLAFRYSFESLDFLWNSIKSMYSRYDLNPNMKVDFII